MLHRKFYKSIVRMGGQLAAGSTDQLQVWLPFDFIIDNINTQYNTDIIHNP